MALSQKEIEKDLDIACAVCNLIAAMDENIPDWRSTTLDQKNGDIVNMSWDLLIKAIEG